MCEDYYASNFIGDKLYIHHEDNGTSKAWGRASCYSILGECPKCISEIVKEIRKCNTTYAKVSNKNCWVEFNISSLYPEKNFFSNLPLNLNLIYSNIIVFALTKYLASYILILVIFFSIVYIIKVRNEMKYQIEMENELRSNENSVENGKTIQIPVDFFLDYNWIEESWLDIGNLIGSGSFGDVYYGLLKLPDAEDCYPVAIKTSRNTGEIKDY